MMNHTILILILSAMMVMNCGNQIKQKNVPRQNLKRIIQNYTAIRKLPDDLSRFTIQLQKVVANERNDNYIFSPLGVNIIMTIINYGVKGETEKYLRSITSSTTMKKKSRLHGYRTLINELNNEPGVALTLANEIFTTTNLKINTKFKNMTKKNFHSQFKKLDFMRPKRAAQMINNWIATKIRVNFEEVIKSTDIENCAMIIINAIRFRGKPYQQFTSVGPLSFFVERNLTKEVDMIYNEGIYNWATHLGHLDAEYIEIPYRNSNISMFIIVPNKINEYKDLEQRLDEINFARLERNPSKVSVLLPKFTIQSHFDLGIILEKIGIYKLFSSNVNFQKIVKNSSLRVGKIMQKAFIEIKEDTVNNSTRRRDFSSLIMKRMIVINRPFLCAVMMKIDNKMIHIINARVADPTL